MYIDLDIIIYRCHLSRSSEIMGWLWILGEFSVENTHPMSSPAHGQIVAFTNFQEEKGGGAFAEGYRFSWRN